MSFTFHTRYKCFLTTKFTSKLYALLKYRFMIIIVYLMRQNILSYQWEVIIKKINKNQNNF